MAVVLAVIALLGAVAAVYFSPGSTRLRSTVRNLKFDLEQARQEAVKRNATVRVAFSRGLEHFDCNEDGSSDSKDSCYVLYEDVDGMAGFDPNRDMEIKRVQVDPSIDIAPEEVTFWQTGTSTSATIRLAVEVPDQECEAQSPCWTIAYEVSTNLVGRVSVSEAQEGCTACTQ
jgi:Tfp pilus assembly protein FimT